MRAVILAAGRGKRMGALTDGRPKCLTEVGGRTLLDVQLGSLRQGGAEEVAVVRGYRKEMISPAGVTCIDNPRWDRTNMVESLLCAAAWIDADGAIVSYSDILYPAQTVRLLAEARGSIVVAYNAEWLEVWRSRFADPLEDAETFRIDATGRLLDIGARARSVEEIDGQYMGLVRFTGQGWRDFERHVRGLGAERLASIDMTSALSSMLRSGARVDTVRVAGKWFEFDNAGDIAAYERWMATAEAGGS